MLRTFDAFEKRNGRKRLGMVVGYFPKDLTYAPQWHSLFLDLALSMCFSDQERSMPLDICMCFLLESLECKVIFSLVHVLL